MGNRRYTYCLTFTASGGEWQIIDMGSKGYCSIGVDPVVWAMPWCKDHEETEEPPPEFRAKYEALLAESGWVAPDEPAVNIVEFMTAGGEDCAWDQPCAHGHRAEFHAVYCHNKDWLYAPRKCRRTQGPSVWSQEAWPHEKCPGFKANPLHQRAS